MYAHREILTIDDPQTLVLSKPLPLRKNQRIEIVILADEEDTELENLRDVIAVRGITESDVEDAITWARSKP